MLIQGQPLLTHFAPGLRVQVGLVQVPPLRRGLDGADLGEQAAPVRAVGEELQELVGSQLSLVAHGVQMNN